MPQATNVFTRVLSGTTTLTITSNDGINKLAVFCTLGTCSILGTLTLAGGTASNTITLNDTNNRGVIITSKSGPLDGITITGVVASASVQILGV